MWFYNMGIIWIYIGSIEVDFRYSWIKILEFIQSIPKFRQLWEKILKFYHCSKIKKIAVETFPHISKKEKKCNGDSDVGDIVILET